MDDDRPPKTSTAPEWSAISEDVLCPLCDYNLRMLVEPQCPECGYRFEWTELLDPSHRVHPFLFEHHPERNIWSFWRTAVAGFRPVRFWKELRPAMPSRPRRLIVYWLSVGLFGALGAGSLLAWYVATGRPIYLGFIPFELQFTLFSRWIQGYDDVSQLLVSCCCLIAFWPWLTFLALLIFQVSMRRARVKTTHVLRCVLYSFDTLVWVGLVGMVAVFLFAIDFTNASRELGPLGLCAIACIALVYGSIRLWSAYRNYLRFHAPLATVLASQIMVLLFIVTLLFVGG